MTRVIYADVLVIINIYITYGLLSLTAIFCKKQKSRPRVLVSSVLSGFYALIILIPNISDTVISLSKLAFSALMLLIAFGRMNKKQFFKAYLTFFLVNFVFGGLMLALWLFVMPKGMYYNSSIVYFEIDTVTLLLLTLVCYFVLSFLDRFVRHKSPADTVYDCKIHALGKSYFCHCFLDTGNSLTDCYTGSPVVIVSRDVFSDAVPENPFESKLKFRLIPCSTVSQEGMLYAFTSEKIEIRGLKNSCSLNNITVALTHSKIRQGNYDGILPCDIFENSLNEREKEYAHKTDIKA